MELNFTGTDLCAINGTRSPPEARYDLVVVGAGRGGTAAAIAAAGTGSSVLLVDENPVSGALMGNDVPLYFGGRMTAATQNSERMLEAIFMSAPATGVSSISRTEEPDEAPAMAAAVPLRPAPITTTS